MRRFSFDLPLDCEEAPLVGDLLVAPVAVYVMRSVHAVESKVWGNRWATHVERIGDRSDHQYAERRRTGPDDPGVWITQPYRRGERPADVFGEAA